MASLLSKLKRILPGQSEIGWDDPRHPRHAYREVDGPVAMLYTTREFPIYFLSIAKCGCTYMQNLFYYLDTGKLHHDPDNIHDYRGDRQRPVGKSIEDIQDEEHAFCITRDPAARFMSNYFDKLWNDESHFDFLRDAMLREPGVVIGPDISLEQPRSNCMAFINWLDRNIQGQTEVEVNRHWVRQQRRQKQARALHLKALTLDGLNWQLPRLIGDVVPDIAERMAEVKTLNATKKPFTYDQILTPAIRARIGEVYKGDAWVYNKVRTAWDGVAAGDAGAEIPRLLPPEK